MSERQLNDLLKTHASLTAEARELLARKSRDYAGNDDIWKNFRAGERFGVPAVKALLLKASDKLARMDTLAERGTVEVEEETLRDTALDLVNYAVMLYEFARTECRSPNTVAPDKEVTTTNDGATTASPSGFSLVHDEQDGFLYPPFRCT